MRPFLVFLTILVCPIQVLAQFEFKNAEIRTTFGEAEQGTNGRIVVDGKSIRFVSGNGKQEYFAIPTNSVTELFYSRVSGRRIKTAIVVSPLLLLTKGRKHYMTMAFDDKGGIAGAVEFQLDKNNYRGVLRTIEQASGVSMQYDQEGIKGTEQDVAIRSDANRAESTVVRITSDPPQAEIEIDGAFAGTSPRTKALSAGKYRVSISKQGYKSWEREVAISEGEEIDIHAALEPK